MTTIEAGEGYRLLEADDVLQPGDECKLSQYPDNPWVDDCKAVDFGRTVAADRAIYGAGLVYRRRVSTPAEAIAVDPRPPCPHRTDTLSVIHQEVQHLRAKLATANYSAAEAEERARRAERDLTGLRGVHQAIGEALIRVWPSEPRDWVRKVEAIGGEMGALRREAQALRDQVRCVGPETCGECLACVRSDLAACKRERDAARAAAMVPERGTPPAGLVEGLRGLAEREAAPEWRELGPDEEIRPGDELFSDDNWSEAGPSIGDTPAKWGFHYRRRIEARTIVTAPEPPEAMRDLFARVRDDYESVLTLVRAFLDAESDAERAEAVAELRVYALGPEEDEPVALIGPGIPLGPSKPEPFIGETPVREWVIGREPPPAREVVAPAIALGLAGAKP